MHFDRINQINKDIERTGRAIISLGCSFVEGQGSITEEIYNKYSSNWKSEGDSTGTVEWNFTEDDRKKIAAQHSNITFNEITKIPSFSKHEYDNSFVSILANKYFNSDYAAINLGRRGCGNRATIKELHYYPDILWNQIKECIVIYCPSGLERFDFILDAYHNPNEYGRWIAMWPAEIDETGPRKTLWQGYKDCLYSPKFEVLEQICHIRELLLWCEYKNAKLIITPAFQRNYTKSQFATQLKKSIQRNSNGTIITQVLVRQEDDAIKETLNMWPWENMFEPDGCPTFADLIMKQEFPATYLSDYFYSYIGTGTPNKWFTPCAHPSAKGHDVFAQFLYKEIIENLSNYSVTYR
jgi:hypothetical protein